MGPLEGEIAFVLAGGPALPFERLALLDEFLTIGVDLAPAGYEPTMTFVALGADTTAQRAAAAARWALEMGCRPVCLLGVDLAGPGRAEVLELLAGGSVWLWPYRGRTFERMVRKQKN